jgi:hypothetical protein
MPGVVKMVVLVVVVVTLAVVRCQGCPTGYLLSCVVADVVRVVWQRLRSCSTCVAHASVAARHHACQHGAQTAVGPVHTQPLLSRAVPGHGCIQFYKGHLF